MKNQQLFIFLTLLLLSFATRCSISNLPFLQGKYIYWLFITVIGSSFFILQNRNREWKFNLFDFCILILFFIGLWNFLYLSNARVYNIKVWYFVGYLLLYIVLRRSIYIKEMGLEILEKIYCLLLILALLNSIIAIMQKNKLLSSSNEYFQVTGLFFSPNHLALFLAIGIISLIELIKKNKSRFNKTLFFTFFLFLIYSLYLSKCRGAYVALIVAILFKMNVLKQEIKKLSFYKKLIFVSVTLCTFFVMIWNTNIFKSESVSGRLFIIKHSLSQLKHRPFTGYGFDSFSIHYNLAKADYFSIEKSWKETRNAAYLYNANNDFLELGFELGMIWIIVFCIFIIILFIKTKNNKKTKSCLSIILCIIVFTFTNTIIPVPLFVVLGCTFSVILINELEIKPFVIVKKNNLLTSITTIYFLVFLTIILLRLHAEYSLMKIYTKKEIFNIRKTKNYVSKIDANGEQDFMVGLIFLKKNNQEEGLKYSINGFTQSRKPSLGKKLAKLLEKMEKYDDAEKIYIYNKNVEPYRFDARMDLFNLYLKTNQKEKAIKIANEILYLPIKIPSQKIHLYKQKAKYYLQQ